MSPLPPTIPGGSVPPGTSDYDDVNEALRLVDSLAEQILIEPQRASALLEKMLALLTFMLRDSLNGMLESRIGLLSKIEEVLTKAKKSEWDKQIAQWKQELEAQNKSPLAKIFTRIAQALLIVVTLGALVMCPPLFGIVLGICAAWMVAQLAASIQEDLTSRNFMRGLFTTICGGNENVARWVVLGIDIGTGLVSFAGLFAKGAGGASGVASAVNKARGIANSALKVIGSAMPTISGKVSQSFLTGLQKFFKSMLKMKSAELVDMMKSLIGIVDDGVSALKGVLSDGASKLASATTAVPQSIKNLETKLSTFLQKFAPWATSGRGQSVIMQIGNFFGIIATAYSIATEVEKMDIAQLKAVLEKASAELPIVEWSYQEANEELKDVMSSISSLESRVANAWNSV